MSGGKDKFCLLGIVTSPDYQRCKSLIQRLKISYANRYQTPSVVPMLDLDWGVYLRKIQREIGGKLWTVRKPFVVFLNGNYLGDDVDLQKYLASIYKFGIERDFGRQGERDLLEMIAKEKSTGRSYVYLTVAADQRVIGTMLFLLYNDLVPKTSALFLKRMKSRTNGFIGAPIHRIVRDGWLQCGGHDVPPKSMPCENYAVPHDKRGVLSMCNTARHRNNTVQFSVSLNANAWMNYRYVAFGQMVHGDRVLTALENLPTHYQQPVPHVLIVDTGEFNGDNKFVERYATQAEIYLMTDHRYDEPDLRHLPSVMSVSRLRRGFYYTCDDLRSHPSLIDAHVKRILDGAVEEEEEDEKYPFKGIEYYLGVEDEADEMSCHFCSEEEDAASDEQEANDDEEDRLAFVKQILSDVLQLSIKRSKRTSIVIPDE